MRLRPLLFALASLVSGVALVGLAVLIPGVHPHELWTRIAHTDKAVFGSLMLLIGANSFLSACRWRLTDRRLRGTATVELSRFESFALTSMGTALGQFLPGHLSLPISRTLGTWAHGRATRRGILGTFFEQAFDLVFVCFVMVASVATRLLHRGALMWVIIAVSCAAVAIISCGAILSAARRWTARAASGSGSSSTWRRYAVELNSYGLLEPALGRKLMLFSAARFIVLVFTAGEVGRAIHAGIPLWHFAFAMPAAVLATAVGITPAALGIWELTYAGALTLLGTPLAVTTSLALANRVLCSAASILVAIFLLPFFVLSRARRPVCTRELACGTTRETLSHGGLEHTTERVGCG